MNKQSPVIHLLLLLLSITASAGDTDVDTSRNWWAIDVDMLRMRGTLYWQQTYELFYDPVRLDFYEADFVYSYLDSTFEDTAFCIDSTLERTDQILSHVKPLRFVEGIPHVCSPSGMALNRDCCRRLGLEIVSSTGSDSTCFPLYKLRLLNAANCLSFQRRSCFQWPREKLIYPSEETVKSLSEASPASIVFSSRDIGVSLSDGAAAVTSLREDHGVVQVGLWGGGTYQIYIVGIPLAARNSQSENAEILQSKWVVAGGLQQHRIDAQITLPYGIYHITIYAAKRGFPGYRLTPVNVSSPEVLKLDLDFIHLSESELRTISP